MPREVAALALACFVSGCASTTFLGGARTLPPGRVEVVAAPVAGTLLPANYPISGVLHARMGLTDRLDVGLRAFPFGGYAEGRYQLHRSAPGDGDGDFLVALRLGGRRWYDLSTPEGFVALPSAQVFVVGGFELGSRAILLIGQHLELDANQSTARAGAGLNLGVRIRLTSWLALLPEYSASLTIAPASATIVHEAAVAVILTIPGE